MSAAVSLVKAETSGRRALLLRTVPPVLVLVAGKVLVERLDWEFIEVSPLHTSIWPARSSSSG